MLGAIAEGATCQSLMISFSESKKQNIHIWVSHTGKPKQNPEVPFEIVDPEQAEDASARACQLRFGYHRETETRILC